MGDPAAATLPPLDADLDRLPEPGGPADANADALIAELAGEQIDKLLAESDALPAPAATATAAATAPGPASVQPAVVVDPVPTPSPVETSSVETSPATAAVAEPASVTAAELDAVLSEAAVRIAAADATIPLPPPPPLTRPVQPLPSPPRPAGVSLLLRPLVWANAPLAACPERVREAAGKVAIVTFVNALGVLAYALAFHRPR